jgi:hypothetical protein
LKRFTPRARGRGNRINKRTCHVTIVLGRLDEARLEVVQAREAKRTAAGRRRPAAGGTTASRRARVERSRQRAAQAKGGTAETHDHDHDHDHDDVDQELIDTSAFTGELPTGAHGPLDDDSQPEGFEIKGNADSMLYHLPGTPFYDRTIAEVWFDTAENAEAAGYQLPPSQRDEDEASDEPAADAADDEGAN